MLDGAIVHLLPAYQILLDPVPGSPSLPTTTPPELHHASLRARSDHSERETTPSGLLMEIETPLVASAIVACAILAPTSDASKAWQEYSGEYIYASGSDSYQALVLGCDCSSTTSASFPGVLMFLASPGFNLSDNHAESLDAGGPEELDEGFVKELVIRGAALVEGVSFGGVEVLTSEVAASLVLRKPASVFVSIKYRAPL